MGSGFAFFHMGDLHRFAREGEEKRLNFCRWLILIIACLFSPACANLTGRVPEIEGPSEKYEAIKLVSDLREQNAELRAFKGKGKITFWKNDKKNMVAGVAWVGSMPDRLRITIRNITGQPLLSFANDGNWFYFLSHADGQFYKKRSTDANLKRFISIPIKSIDMFSILAGRAPVVKYSSAEIVKNGSDDGYILILKKRWGHVLEKIYLDENKKEVRKVETFDGAGDLAYRAEIYGMREIQGYQIPSRLVLSNDDGSVFQLDIDRYWADVSVSPSIFGLTSPE